MQPGELIASDLGARPAGPTDLVAAWAILSEVMDPEVPVVSVVDLGIVRDVVQNHLLQILSLVAMEAPHRLASEANVDRVRIVRRRDRRLARFPVVHAIAFRRQADVEAHDAQGGGFGGT